MKRYATIKKRLDKLEAEYRALRGTKVKTPKQTNRMDTVRKRRKFIRGRLQAFFIGSVT